MKYIDSHTHQATNETDVLELHNIIIGETKSLNHSVYSAGIHPWYFKQENMEQYHFLLKQMVSNPNCIAIGECGLDKLRGAEMKLQEQVFNLHIQLAIQTGKPLIIHNVRKFNRILELIKQQHYTGKLIFHGYTGKLSQAIIALQNPNVYFSFGKALLNPKSNATALMMNLPINRYLLETDDSDTSIKILYRKASQLLNVTENQFMRQMIQNFNFIFDYGNDRKR